MVHVFQNFGTNRIFSPIFPVPWRMLVLTQDQHFLGQRLISSGMLASPFLEADLFSSEDWQGFFPVRVLKMSSMMLTPLTPGCFPSLKSTEVKMIIFL